MSKHEKSLEKLSAKPPAADIRWDELVSVLQHLGFTLISNSGSRRKFHHAGKNVLIICHEPHPQPTVDKGCIADVAETLQLHGWITR